MYSHVRTRMWLFWQKGTGRWFRAFPQYRLFSWTIYTFRAVSDTGRTRFQALPKCITDWILPEAREKPVYATGNGKVIEASRNFFGYGNEVIIDHGFGYKTRYAHLSEILVKEGQMVERGDQVGKLGNSGRSSGPHLHYEVMYRDRRVNPLNFFNSDLKGTDFEAMLNKENAGRNHNG